MLIDIYCSLVFINPNTGLGADKAQALSPVGTHHVADVYFSFFQKMSESDRNQSTRFQLAKYGQSTTVPTVFVTKFNFKIASSIASFCMTKYNFNAHRSTVFKDTPKLPNNYKSTDKTNRRTIIKIVTEKAEGPRHNISTIFPDQYRDTTLINIRLTPLNTPISA